MTAQSLKIIAYVTSIVLILAGETAVWFLFRDHAALPYLLIGYPVIGLFFLGMKLTLVRNMAIGRRSGNPPEE